MICERFPKVLAATPGTNLLRGIIEKNPTTGRPSQRSAQELERSESRMMLMHFA
jgi:hypothetical protein